MTRVQRRLGALLDGDPLSRDEALKLGEDTPLEVLAKAAAQLRDAGFGDAVSYSRKVFIPLTHLCRDQCHYCTFAHPPRPGEAAYLGPDEVLDVARRGAQAGCREALFTLGDKPELRYRTARAALENLGHSTTLSYLEEMAGRVLRETGLLPHLNPGLMTTDDLLALRRVSVSMGIMLETACDRLGEPGGPHYGSPDKVPQARLDTLERAGLVKVPFTSGILIGIGETRRERLEALLVLRDVHRRHAHLQEVIIQNFRAKPDTPMAQAPEPSLDELRWTVAMARLVFGSRMSVQAPPNLSPGALGQIVDAGINDWGGVSPVTPDFVNPEAPWPHLEALARETEKAGKVLVERLAVYPPYALDPEPWLDEALRPRVLAAMDSQGFARAEEWSPGTAVDPPATDLARVLHARSPETSSNPDPTTRRRPAAVSSTALTSLPTLLARAQAGDELSAGDLITLFSARGGAFSEVCAAADELRRGTRGDEVTYVVNRNINYTNVCYFRCQFCAFSKGKLAENLRGRPYDLGLEEIQRRAVEAWERGATEVCMQGGIHPDYTGATYLRILEAVKDAVPQIHVHAFTPLEVSQGASTLGLTIPAFLSKLQEAGLGTLPGTAAEVLDDEVRQVLCPDKITTDQWLQVMEEAHALGLRSTATVMYGHVDAPLHWARHLLRLRRLQERTGGFTEFVPLPFVHMEAPIYLKGRARKGPTFREAILMHAVARLALHPHIRNIQVSWVKMGPQGVAAALNAGVNDLGGTLMNESITRAAGATHGQEMPPERMDGLIEEAGRVPVQRTTLYGRPGEERIRASFNAAPLAEVTNALASEYVGESSIVGGG